MFFAGSRYAALQPYATPGPDGSLVRVVPAPVPGPPNVLGFYRRKPNQRLDLMADFFMGDPTAFWTLCDANNAMVPDALAHRSLVGIPTNAKVRS